MIDDVGFSGKNGITEKPSDHYYVTREIKGKTYYIPVPKRFHGVFDLVKYNNYAPAINTTGWKEFTKYIDSYERILTRAVENEGNIRYGINNGFDAIKPDVVTTAYDMANVTSSSNSTTTGGGPGATTIVPPGNSGGSVDDGTIDLSIYDPYQAYIEAIQRASEAQSAREREAAEAQNAWQRETNQIAMDYNAAEAAKNRDWQEYMSNTAHQREVQDLMAAGLNPVLSASGGNGAAVTSGATASGVTSPGAKANVDNTFVLSLLSFLNNVMGYATSTAAAGISAGGVIGAANIAAESARTNTTTEWGLIRRLLDTFTAGLFK